MQRFVPSLLAVALALGACRSTEPASAPGRDFVLVILRSGDRAKELSAERRTDVQAQHMANIRRLADEGVLFIAGPFGQPNPDPTRRGLFVFDVADVQSARELTGSDPAVQAGVLAMDLIPLSTSADFERVHETDVRQMRANREAGRDLGAGFEMHTFTFGFVGGGERAHRALCRAIAPGGVLAVGACGAALEGSSAVWIDAPDVATAEQKLAGIRGELGPLDLTPWWGSATLVQLADGAAAPR